MTQISAESRPRVVDTAYWLGDVVFLRFDREGDVGIITTVMFFPGGHSYQVSWPSGNTTTHYDIELTDEFVLRFPEAQA